MTYHKDAESRMHVVVESTTAAVELAANAAGLAVKTAARIAAMAQRSL
jgi:hypothetical protein